MSLFPIISPVTSDLSWIGTITTAGLTTNLKLCLDAGDSNSYASGTSWLDTSGNGYDFFFGDTASGASDDPTFNGSSGGLSSAEYMSTDGGDNFTYDSAVEAWMSTLHKDNAILSIIGWVYVPASAAENIWLSTADATGGSSNGVSMHVDAAEKQRFIVWNAVGSGGVLSKDGDTALSTGAWHFIAVSIDEAAGPGGGFLYLDGNYNQVSSSDTFDATYSSPTTNAAQGVSVFETWAGYNACVSGYRIAGLMMWQGTALTKANFDTLWTAQKGRFGL